MTSKSTASPPSVRVKSAQYKESRGAVLVEFFVIGLDGGSGTFECTHSVRQAKPDVSAAVYEARSNLKTILQAMVQSLEQEEPGWPKPKS